MINFRTALLVSLIAGLTACSSGGSDGDDPRVPDPVNGGDQAPVSLDFSSTPEGNPVEDERWEYQIETNAGTADSVTFRLLSGPTGMEVSPGGRVTWTPTDDHGDTVNVTLEAVYDDGETRLTAQQEFTLQVVHVNDKPLIVSTAPSSAILGGWFRYQVEVADSDDVNNGTDLIFSASLPLVLEANRDKYNLEISPTGLVSLFIPQDFLSDIDTEGLGLEKMLVVSVSVTDGEEDWRSLINLPSRQQWNLQVVEGNLPPEIISDPVTTATEDVKYQYLVEALDIAGQNGLGFDINDDLSFTLTDAPQGMTISSAGLIEWTPTEQGAEPYSENVTVVVADGGEDGADPATQSFSIDVTPVNDAPVLLGAPVSFVDIGTTYSYQVEVLDPDDDNNGTDLTFSLLTAPEGMTVTDQGYVTWIPELASGLISVEVEVVDGGEDGAVPATQSWTIEVRGGDNIAPVIDQGETSVLTMAEDSVGRVTFTASDVNGDTLNWMISSDAGNGAATVSDSGEVTYTPDLNYNGTDSFTVEVSDGVLSDTIDVSVTISAVNDKPVIVSEKPTSAVKGAWFEYQMEVTDVDDENNGTDLTFTASLPLVSEANRPQYNLSVSSTGLVRVYVPTSYSYSVLRLKVGVTDGEEDWRNGINVAPYQFWDLAIVGGNTAPVITSEAVTTATEDVLYSYQVAAEDSAGETAEGDPLQDELTYSLTEAPAGMTISDTGLIEWTPAENGASSYSENVTVIVADGGENDVEAATQSFTVTVTPVNDSPVLSGTPTSFVQLGNSYSYQLEVADADDNNNGSDLTFNLVTAPSGMTVSDTGLVTWTPAIAAGVYNVAVSVTDGGEDGAIPATLAWTVEVRAAANVAPVINEESASIEIDEDTQGNETLTATDANGDTLTWSVISAASNGSATVTGGNVTYTPAANFHGSDSFTVQVSDGDLTDLIVVDVTVNSVNDLPVIDQGATTSLTTPENTEGNITLTASDADGDSLSWSVSAAATHGSASVVDGNVSYTPNENFNGSDSFTVQVTDGTATDIIVVNVTVTAVNQAPVIDQSEASVTTDEDTEGTTTLTATDTDGDVLSWSVSSAASNGLAAVTGGNVTYTPNENFNGSDSFTVLVSDGELSDTIEVSVTVNELNDAPVIDQGATTILTTDEDEEQTLVLSASDVENDSLNWSVSSAAANGFASVVDGTVTYQPAPDFNGTDAFVVMVSDGTDSATIAVSVTVNAVNDLPEITSSAITTATEGVEYSYAVLASDVEDDSLTFSLNTAPAGMSISSSGVITWTPADGISTANVIVAVSDGSGSVTQSFTIAVTDVNDAPVITSVAPTSVVLGEEYTYTPSATDTENDTLTWNLTQKPAGMTINATTGAISWTPAEAGSSGTVRLVANDGNSDSVAQTFVITVSEPDNEAPVIAQGETDTLTTDEDTQGSTTLIATDANGDSLSWSVSSPASNGSAAVVGGNVTYTPNANFNGNDSFTVQVSDGSLTDSIVVNVTVNAVNDLPVIAQGAGTTLTTAENTATGVTLNASDVDGDSLSWSVSTAASDGSASVTAGNVSYTPNAGFNGNDSFTVQVFDGTAPVSFVVNVEVTAVNDAPVIDQETASVSTSEDNQGTTALTATDIDSASLSWTVSVAASHGSAAVSDGNVTYTPHENFNGSDSFTVQVSDGELSDSIVVSVTVTAVNDAPVFANAASTSAVEGSEYRYQAEVTDPDDANNGTDLTFTLDQGSIDAGLTVSGTGLVTWTPDNGVTSTSVSLSVADGGEDGASAAVQNWTITVGSVNDAPVITSEAPTTATEGVEYQYSIQVNDPDDANNGTDLIFTPVLVPEGMSVSNMGLVTWTPENGVESANVEVQVRDGGESGALPDSQSWTITVSPVNDAPEITEGASVALPATEDVQATLALNATDIDNSGAELTWSVLSAPVNGVAAMSGTGNSQSLTYTGNADFNGSDTLVVQVTDGDLTDTITVNVTVAAVNDAAVFTSTPVTTATEGEAYVYFATASDVEGDTLNFSLPVKPVGMSINSTTGEMTWTPANGVESANVTVRVNDGITDTNQSFTITVTAVNNAPDITSVAVTTATEGELYSYTVTASDIDSSDLTFSLTEAPAGMSIDSESGVITWTPENGVESAAVSVEVSDSDLTDSQNFTITVTAVNDAPEIDQGESTVLTTDEDETQTLSLSATDIDGDSLSWSVTSGAANGEASVDSAGLVTYVPAADFNGSDTFTVQVSDGELTDSILVDVSVSEVNDAPVVAQGSVVSMTTAEDTQKSVTLTASDVDGDSLNWAVSTPASNGSAAVAAGVVSYTPAMGYNGSDSFVVSVSDGTETVTVQINVTVTAENDAPVIDQAEASITTAEDTQGTVSLSATDPEGTSLNWSITGVAANGTASVSSSGLVTYDPAANFNGSDSFTVTVSDGDLSDSIVVAVSVTAVNDAPEITEGEAASLSTDEDNMGSVTLNATDVEGDAINWSIQSQASDGVAVVSGAGTSQTVNYTPAADFHGSDSFVVRVSDGDLTDTITVNVTVNAANDAPVITSTEVTTATEGEAYLYTVAANDVDGDALTFSLTEAPEGMVISGSTINWTPENGVETANVTVTVADATAEATQSFTITVTPVNDAPSITSAAVTNATEGEAYSYTVVAEDVDSTELTYSLPSAPEGMNISGATISWTPANGVESANVTVEVSDGSLSDSQSFIITVGATNDAPEIDQGAVTALTTDEDTSATLNLTATDVDSESLTWRISNASENGSASVDASGVVSYEPAADFNGSDSFEVEVSDSELTDTIVVNVTVNPVADAPVIAEGETASRTTNEDTPLTFALNATDVDGGTLTWSISSGASEGTATVSGTGASQTVSYTPAPDFNGTDSFVVQVSDGALTDTINVTMTVTSINDLPEITSVAPVVATEGELYTYLPTATDVEGDALTWNVGTAPASMTVNSATGELNWTPAEGVTSAEVTLLVNDGGANVTQAFTITVTAVNNAPVITQGESTSVTMSEDGAPTPFTLVLNATDSDHAGSELSWSVSSAATNGTATVSGTGLSKTVNYTPDTGFSGADSFTVQVTDGELTDSIVVNVTVEAVNAAPVIDQGDTTTMTLDEDGTQTLSLSATDSDGDSLTWSVTSSASDGGVSVDTNGLVTYVPVADFNGSDTFTIQVSDSELTDSITVSVTVNSVNDVPVIAEGASVTLEVNEDSSDSVTFTASDADGDPLTWSISSGAVEGIVTQTGSEFSYAPAADFNGSDSFVVQVSDGTATGTSTVNVTVIAVNDAPVVTSSPVTTANEYQVYAYDVAASDAEGDAVSYSLTNPPAGMVISSAGEIRWIPESAGTYSVVVNATDGSDAGTQSFDITVNAEPAVAGRAVKGVLANAPVEAAVYAGLDAEGEHSWNVIGTTTTDANGYFGFNLGTQSAPVRVRVTTDAETTMVCDTPSGCLVSPPANFGDSGTPAAGMILDTIVSGADFGGPVAVTPMTHMAATWLQAFPQALDDNNVLLAHKRLAVLFGFTDDSYVSQRVPDLTDAFERNFALSSDEQALRHAIFSASLQETAIVASLPIDSLAENIGLIFGLLGGQMPLKSGELDVSTLGLTDPDTEEPITTISYTGFDTFVASAETVGQFINDGSLDTMIAGFGSLVTDWSPELADPSICLVTDNPELDRTECRNVTTIGEATGYDAANFARALAPIDVAGGYLDDAQAAELANGSTVNRDLGWLYVDEAAQNETAEMLGGLTEVLGYGLKTALCVPQKNNIPYTCTMEKSAGFESLNVSLSNCEGYNGDDSCDLRVTGSANGQSFNVSSRIEDIREMLGGKRRIGLFQTNYDFTAGPLPMCFTGTISNSIATMNLNNFCLILNVSDSRSDLLAPFEDLNAVAYTYIGDEGSDAYNAMENLLDEIVLEIGASGGLSLASTDSNIGTYSMSNIDMSFVFDRESLVKVNKGTPVFDFEVASFSRTNPWGETLNSVSGYPMFKLQVDDTTILTGRNVKDNVGVPPTLSVTNAIVEGLGPVVDIAKEYALSMIDTTVAAPELTPEQWDAIIAEVEANLAYNGTITTTIQDPSVGDRTYIATLTPEGNVFISQENSTANAMQLYLSGATGYIYADETLVATAHLGNSQDGMLLSFVDGSQRRYTNANPNLSGQLDSFLEFLQVLVPPAEETAP
ncbi:VCBS repeat-containing protein [Thalassolituus maritimus]|uniref:VCBS repeat-containing protein n=1 Tax=Thalassolituus maritimus TaxID=484498 RepID=A0A1N7KP99_9GAMM|nr:Ig-like domain-containing protein [Thalassolituus maritimus]SIS63415.1 VCBS repeat-containing protein [Thalassolituus maritimus]